MEGTHRTFQVGSVETRRALPAVAVSAWVADGQRLTIHPLTYSLPAGDETSESERVREQRSEIKKWRQSEEVYIQYTEVK